MVQLSATMEQTRETQLAQLYDVLGFRRVIARYDALTPTSKHVGRKQREQRCYIRCPI